MSTCMTWSFQRLLMHLSFLSLLAGILTSIHHSFWAMWSAWEEGGPKGRISQPPAGRRMWQSPVCAGGRRRVSAFQTCLVIQPLLRIPCGLCLTGSFCYTPKCFFNAKRHVTLNKILYFSLTQQWPVVTQQCHLLIPFGFISNSVAIISLVNMSKHFQNFLVPFP